ncbi:hypothetical protein HK103_003306 [Boothiomyces macroporosus]|uniref:SPIN90/Ldb17 leucine-rich domain-containing protein n=1 Tax=Boothiomyces macroporosus TaxID=261099 RepID=A0AAD5Y950_9FUNG|nr:hypothetical protein HK103_003306 [Boothiomyces macroporosus]
MDPQELLDQLQKYRERSSREDFIEILDLVSQYNVSLRHLEIIIQEIHEFDIFDDIKLITNELYPNVSAHLSILLSLGHVVPNIYRKLCDEDWFTVLVDINSPRESHLSHLLLVELLQCHELTNSELEIFNSKYITRVCQTVYDQYYQNEEYTNSAIVLLLVLQGQFSKKSGDISQTLLNVFGSDEIGHWRKEISLAMIFVYNREESAYMQELMVDLLTSLSIQFPNFFYTNDITVLFDITMRETTRIQDHNLRQKFIRLLPLLIECIPVESPGSKQHLTKQLRDKLDKINSSPMTPTY